MRAANAPLDTGPLPSAWRASRVTLVMGALAGVVIAWLGATGPGLAAGIAGGTVVATISIFAEMQAAWRLRRALARFAAAFPAHAREAFESWGSEQGIRWPALALEVRGRVASYRVDDILVELGADSFLIRPRDARRAGVAAARRLGIAGVPAR